ncbi:MAG: glycosyltransferase family 39 protein [Deltaproteobacteria bacterium]|nr:glycosyltransferase family 39 protein [Deltaproteobacteria bacterium]
MTSFFRRLEPAHWIALGAALLLLPRLGQGPLHTPWETHHAAVAARMAEDGPASAFTPAVGDEAYLERPATGYWLGALATRVFGPGTFAARLPSALAGVLLLWAAFVLVRRGRGTRAGALVAGVLATTPLCALLFRSARPDALAVTASCGSFLALAAAAVDPGAPRRVAWAGWALLGLAAGLGGLPAVAPPLAAIVLFATLGGRRPAWGALRPLAGLAIAVVVAAPLVVPPLALHGAAVTRAFFRPDVAEESPADDEKVKDRGRPDDRMGADVDFEALAWGAFPWSILAPAALIGLSLRRRRDVPPEPNRGLEPAAGVLAEPRPQGRGSDGAGSPGLADGEADERGRAFDFACVLWAVAAGGTAAILGDRFHHAPYGALVPVAVLVGLYVARKLDGEWSAVDAALTIAGIGLLAVCAHDLAGGARLAQAAGYFRPELPALPKSVAAQLAWPLRLATLGAGAALLGALLLRRWRWWIAAAAVAVSLAWTLGVVHVLGTLSAG